MQNLDLKEKMKEYKTGELFWVGIQEEGERRE
jgi:hypothetical protein